MKKKGVVFLFGGGIDSVAQVILLNKLNDSPICLLHIDYGQLAKEKEKESGLKLVSYGYADEFYSLTIHKIKNSSNPLFSSEVYRDENVCYDKSKCMIEFRNAMLGVFSLFTILNDERFYKYRNFDICFGFYSYKDEQTYPFPDETEHFLDKMNSLINVYGYTNKFVAPFLHLSKHEIWKQAYEYEPRLFEIAWTCYENKDKQCGRCPHCLYLKEFMKNELNISESEIAKMFIV